MLSNKTRAALREAREALGVIDDALCVARDRIIEGLKIVFSAGGYLLWWIGALVLVSWLAITVMILGYAGAAIRWLSRKVQS